YFLYETHRYLSDEENDLGDQSERLLQQLQKQARTRQQQNCAQNHPVSVEVSGPDNQRFDSNSARESNLPARKRRQHENSPCAESERKRKKRRLLDGEKGLDEAINGANSSRNGNNGEESKASQGCIEESKGRRICEKIERGRAVWPPLCTITPVLARLSFWVFQVQVPPLQPQWLVHPTLVQGRIKEHLIPLQDIPVIHPKLVKKLQANGIESLFPVQAEVIPAILESGSKGFIAGRGGYQPSDICVSAPTGSGKTLAFVIPVIQALLGRVVCQVRALAVLPTKELAQQVRCKVFNIYTDGTGLKVIQLTGQKSFAKEQESLAEKTPTGFRSLADIVVATPGRLVDHLQQSPQFSLRELRFLIVDEADRMIDSLHQDWLQQVAEAVEVPGSASCRLFRRLAEGSLTAARARCPQLPLQKLLFSATLTRDPEKLQRLRLYQPRLFAAACSGKEAIGTMEQQGDKQKYALPEGLSQYYVPCGLSLKPLFLLHFLLTLKFSRVLCFTNSKDTAHRLFLLVQAFGGVSVAEFSSRLSPSERKGTLKEFEQGKIQLLISTDATARGIDISGVKCVISYDAPQFLRTYIHRVGRTARAGKAGLAFTLLLQRQESPFLRMLTEAGLPGLGRHLVKGEALQRLRQQYEEALDALQNIVKEEQARKKS
uniref:ATP-dependent RNA helicase n=1 Tax=Salvator merianae TaxID=96440 RepID=A0A8D0DVS0_SALMN